MARNEKQRKAQNLENRKNARSDEFRPISVKDLKAGISHKATMLNYSKNGMYFEADSILQPGTEIYLGIEERKYPRKPSSKSVHYAANNQILKGTSQNISFSGILIKTKNQLLVGQTVILSLPCKTKKRLQLRGEVVWSNHEGCGVKFVRKKEK